MGEQRDYILNDWGDLLVLERVHLLQKLHALVLALALKLWVVLYADRQLQDELVCRRTVLVRENVMLLQKLLELLHRKSCIILRLVRVCKESLWVKCVHPVYLCHLDWIWYHAAVCCWVPSTTCQAFILQWVFWCAQHFSVLVDYLKRGNLLRRIR